MKKPVRRVYLDPPKYRSKKVEPGSGAGLDTFLIRYGNELAPFIAAWAYMFGAVLIAKIPYAPLWYLALSGVLAVAIWVGRTRVRALRSFIGSRGKGWRPVARRVYALAVPFVYAGWATWATMPNSRDHAWHRPSLWSILVLFMGTWILSFWWLWELRSKRKITLTLDGLAREDLHLARRDAKTLITSWVGWTGRAGLTGTKLRSLSFSPWARCITVELRHGAQTLNWTPLRMNRIETASLWTIAPGMARIDRSDKDTRVITIRYMLSDPHAEKLSPPAFDDMDDQTITLGVFEDAAIVMFEWVNTLIGGCTRAGKSGMVNTLIRAFAKIPSVALIGVDLKPGAPELGPWRDVFAALADSPGKTVALFEQVLAGLQRRGDLMVERGWRTWRVSREEPYIVVIVDEIQRLDRQARKLLADITAIIGAYGGIVIVATQYPVKENLPSAIKQNLIQRIGFRTADDVADRVIFGDSATRTGWSPSKLCPENRRGSFLIRNGFHVRPLLARGWFNEEAEVIRDAATLAAHRTMIDQATWAGEINSRPVDAEIVDDDRIPITSGPATTRDQVMAAIEIGHGTPRAVSRFTGIPERTVKLIIAQLADARQIEQDRPRAPWRPTAFDPDDGYPDE